MRINFHAKVFDMHDGFGRWSNMLLRELCRSGVEVHPITSDMLKAPAWLHPMLGVDLSRPTISLLVHAQFPALAGRQWGFTMYEATRCPLEWGEKVANCERLIVPCQWCADAFSDLYPDMPVHIVPGGFDPAEFRLLERPRPDRPFTFLCINDGRRFDRKGSSYVWQAFYKAFPDNPDVRLITKTKENGLMASKTGNDGKKRYYSVIDSANSDKRTSIQRANTDSFADVLPFCDCYVSPHKAEGWGLTQREAAAMGIPTIATRYSGTADVDCWGIGLGYKEVPSLMEGGGMWASPDVDELAEKMLWVYKNYDQARSDAKRGSEWLHQNQTWEHANKTMIALLERYA